MKALVARAPVPYEPTHGAFDLVKLQRVVEGRMPHTELSREEKVYIALHFEGSARQLAQVLGVNDKTVATWREAAHKPPEPHPERDGGET
ncbi:hypothetical protein SUDANB21_02091 [Streptomyces sp. enrichment culture]|uniref:hypothetical protein n=1 Tax=Streptomyces althioticus TaxID=83380 RepID=UPI00343BAD25